MSDMGGNGPKWYESGTFVGRVWRPDVDGPSLVTIRDGAVVDVTSKACPTVSDLLDMDDPVGYLHGADGETLVDVESLLGMSAEDQAGSLALLAPVDLQAIKACGVTFANSMIERVIEERAAGDFKAATSIREAVTKIVGDSLHNLRPGSPEADQVKTLLIKAGIWSQYLEVGIGPDAEVFSKSQVLSSVGHGADIGIHPMSNWNNPEPEIVLAVSSDGKIQGATLGNDVNLRDFEGRSALLLGKAKDNNASCAIGPFVRLLDDTYSLDDVRSAQLALEVVGPDGFILQGSSSMSEISRDPLDLVSQAIGEHHQYPDGFVLFLGTLFAPVEDRDVPGQGFTHKEGDVVTISNEKLGALRNTVRFSSRCRPWAFGVRELMRNLAKRGLLG
jgi:fumarylacetoacetate (FAA) hydrolase family protein